LIQVDCAVINPSDVLFMAGKAATPKVFPFTPGWEGSGIIVQLGKDHDD